jgi:succinyl-CoA synthetase alpha subunit
MSILVDDNTRLLIQGITGKEGTFHGEQMKNYGTKVVGGVTPGKGGQLALGDVPVFNSVHDAVQATQANATIIYVPARFAADAALEGLDAGLPLVIIISEGIPTLEMMTVYHEAKRRGASSSARTARASFPPARPSAASCPATSTSPARSVGVISRSGTLTYEVVWELTQAGLGQSTCIGIGGDPIIGTTIRMRWRCSTRTRTPMPSS